MKNILIDCRMIQCSGIGIYIEQMLLQLLLSERYNVTLMIEKKHERYIKEKYPSLNYVITPYKRYDLRGFFGNNKTIKKYDCYFMPSLCIPPFIFSDIQIISTIHDLCPIFLKKIFGFRASVSYKIIMLLQLIFSTKIVCISEFTKAQLIECYGSKFNYKVTVIYNGVTKREIIDTDEQSEYQKGSQPFGLVVGNIKPHKNVVPLINYLLNNSDALNFKLVVVGQLDGFRNNENVNVINSEKIVFTGKISDSMLVSYYQNANFFIYPSLYEGFGLPLLEAMYYNLKIFSSDIPVFREIAGNAITYFNPVTFNNLIHKINEYLDNQFNEHHNYDNLLTKFTWDTAGAELIKLIEKES